MPDQALKQRTAHNDALQFLTGQGIDVGAIAPQVEGKFMSAFICAVKPSPKKRALILCTAPCQGVWARTSVRASQPCSYGPSLTLACTKH